MECREGATIRKQRTMSVSTTVKIKAIERSYQLPVHRHADSLLSTSSGFKDFRGFCNLAVLLLVLSSARVALENTIKYGILVDPILLIQLFFANLYGLPNFLIVLGYNWFIMVEYVVERLLAAGKISERFGSVCHFINLGMELLTPCYIILVCHPNPLYSTVAMLLCVIVFLKLISYKETLKWYRQGVQRQQNLSWYKSVSVSKTPSSDNKFNSLMHTIRENQKRNGLNSITDDFSGRDGRINGVIADADVNATICNIYHSDKILHYPYNLNIYDLYYYMLVPTLCYKLTFPRSERTRKQFLIKRISEIVFISGLIIALIQQWVLPLVNNALIPFSEMLLPNMLEQILKLALPNFCIWLLLFYATFHSMFNVLAEILMFEDRVFYHDWWNAESVMEFWKKWNVPVHRWALRHLYQPLLLRGYSKLQSALAVFLLSAFFHELLVSVPLGIFRLYVFMGMLLQVPLAVVTDRFRSTSPKLTNVVVWLSLIIGQPIAVLMYCVDYYIELQRAKEAFRLYSINMDV